MKIDLSKITFLPGSKIDKDLLFSLDSRAFNRDFDTNFKTPEELIQLLKGNDIKIAYLNDIPVGYYANDFTNQNDPEIVGVVVLPEYQNHGIGSLMIKTILFSAKQYPIIKTVTHPQNIIAIHVYKKFGFVESHIDPEYYGKNEPRLVMYWNKPAKI